MENPTDSVKTLAIRGGYIPTKLPTYLKLDILKYEKRFNEPWLQQTS